jgi:hypothetical protein
MIWPSSSACSGISEELVIYFEIYADIREICLWRCPAVHGVSNSMRVFDQMPLRTRFARLKQRQGVSIGVFKQEYDELKATLSGAGVPAMPAAEDAIE